MHGGRRAHDRLEGVEVGSGWRRGRGEGASQKLKDIRKGDEKFLGYFSEAKRHYLRKTGRAFPPLRVEVGVWLA